MWTSKPVPPTRYEAILKAIKLTDEAIDNTADDYTNRKLLLQRLRLVEALAEDENPDDDEDDDDSWKCENCGEEGDSKETLVDGLICPACKSAQIVFNPGEKGDDE